MVRTHLTETHEAQAPSPNGGTKQRKPRTPRSGPRKVTVLIRVVDSQGRSRPLPDDVSLDLLAVTTDPRKILDALRTDRNAIELEYSYPEKAAAGARSTAAAEKEDDWEEEV